MSTIELLYATDCPNVGATRANLLKAVTAAGLPARWSELVIGDPDLPPHAKGYGSPTILVDRADVAGALPGGGKSCRVYEDDGGVLVVAPPIGRIRAALAASAPSATPSVQGWRSSLAVAPGIGAALLPKVACPACWPAYSGVLTTVGLGFLMDEAWLLPVTAAFLTIAVAALGYGARKRRGLRPFALGLLAAATVLVGKFAFGSDATMYGGLGLLVAASLWNSWPRRRGIACPACLPTS